MENQKDHLEVKGFSLVKGIEFAKKTIVVKLTSIIFFASYYCCF